MSKTHEPFEHVEQRMLELDAARKENEMLRRELMIVAEAGKGEPEFQPGASTGAAAARCLQRYRQAAAQLQAKKATDRATLPPAATPPVSPPEPQE